MLHPLGQNICLVQFSMAPIQADSHIHIDNITLLQLPGIWNAMADNFMHKCAAWFWDEMVVQRRRVSPSRNCSLMYDLIYIIRCYPWLDHSCCCIQRVAANPASMSQFCYLQDGIHTNTSKTADPTLQMHPKKWTIQTAVH
jgi:hypothetical protein